MAAFEQGTDNIHRLELPFQVLRPIVVPVAVWLVAHLDGWGRLSPPFGIATPDPRMAEASMVRLGELDYDHLLPSHGRPILGRGRQGLFDYLDRRGTPQESIQ